MQEHTTGFLGWVESRFPVISLWKRHASEYYVPKNLNFWYMFGIFSTVILALQIITGIWLTMYYTPTAADAFGSVEHIMREVKFGWLIRYMHTTGAAMFFIVVYLHMYRAIMYGSSKAPRELVWILGMFLFVCLLVESASGYVLPWGQMSYWAIKVLVSVFTVIPVIGKGLVTWIQGDYNVSGVTLHRFFSFHVIALPMLIVFLSYLHVLALHEVGSNNPDGIDIKRLKDAEGKPVDGITFHPYYTVKDFAAVILFFVVFAYIVFYAPQMGGYFIEHANYAPANALVTPAHILPPWYMAPFYSVLRAIPDKLLGVIIAGSSVLVLFFLPWLDRSPVRSIRYRGVWTKIGIVTLVVSFGGLGLLGTQGLSPTNILLSRIFTALYFAVFIAMPFYTRHERTKPEPTRVNY